MDETKEFMFSAGEKNIIRKAFLSARNEMSESLIISKSNEIGRRAIDIVRGNVMIYVSIGSEVRTRFLIEKMLLRGDKVYLPYTVDGVIQPRRLLPAAVDKPFKPTRFGNLPDEFYIIPQEEIKLDYCITPLIGFNAAGYRIGYGMGCYDRFLRGMTVKKIGLAYSAQAVNFSPDSGDVPLDCCVTENNVIYFNHASDFGTV